jgi:hypothetical protein
VTRKPEKVIKFILSTFVNVLIGTEYDNAFEREPADKTRTVQYSKIALSLWIKGYVQIDTARLIGLTGSVDC